jgi:hypothetical protein
MSTWKWDTQHVVILLAYVLAFGTGIAPYVVAAFGHGAVNAWPALIGLLSLTGTAGYHFVTHIPKDVGEAVQEGTDDSKVAS